MYYRWLGHGTVYRWLSRLHNKWWLGAHCKNESALTFYSKSRMTWESPSIIITAGRTGQIRYWFTIMWKLFLQVFIRSNFILSTYENLACRPKRPPRKLEKETEKYVSIRFSFSKPWKRDQNWVFWRFFGLQRASRQHRTIYINITELKNSKNPAQGPKSRRVP